MIEFLTEEEVVRNNHLAYVRLQPEIDAKYPIDWFVAVHEGRIVADADSFEALDDVLRQRNLKGQNLLVVQSGQDNSELIIL